MRCALFGDQIQAYEDVLKPPGKYEISWAPIGVIDDQHRINVEELPYQMTIGQQTVIQRVNPKAGPILPNYQSLASIPRTAEPNVVAVVLYVEEQPRMITNSRGYESLVREIVVTDTSHDQSITISACNDLTMNEGNLLSNWADRFNVVGFTALKAQNIGKGVPIGAARQTSKDTDCEISTSRKDNTHYCKA
uniref:Uncharacterized protein n=1 Tax=Chenopodium quinoa TaxID=63459 RepID=A0A803N0Z4_CHEQI